jgi:hypothetical protein
MVSHGHSTFSPCGTAHEFVEQISLVWHVAGPQKQG